MLKIKSNSIISLDSIIFGILTIRYIVTVGQESPTPLFYSAALFSIFAYVIMDYFYSQKMNRFRYLLKKNLFLIIIFILIYIPTIFIIFERHTNNNIYYTSDGAIISEVAAKGLIYGQNPYELNFQEPLKNWPYQKDNVSTNPTNNHYPYLPFFTIINSFAYLLTDAFLGFFDIRIPLLLILSLTIYLIFKVAKNPSDKFLFTTAVVFNPVFLPSFLWGLNDIYVLFCTLSCVYLLSIKRVTYSLVFLAFAVTIKLSAWPLVPFVFIYLYFKQKGGLLAFTKVILPFLILSGAILVPFFLWNPYGFYQDIWLFNNGGLQTSTTIGGYGISEVLYNFKIITDRTQNFSFIIHQILVMLTLLPVLLILQKKNNNPAQILFNYSILLLTLWYFSRNLNQNYLAYSSQILTAALFFKNR